MILSYVCTCSACKASIIHSLTIRYNIFTAKIFPNHSKCSTNPPVAMCVKGDVFFFVGQELALEEWQVEVNVAEEADSTISSAEFRRQSSSPEMVIVAHVYLLPNSLDASDIDNMEQVGRHFCEWTGNVLWGPPLSFLLCRWQISSLRKVIMGSCLSPSTTRRCLSTLLTVAPRLSSLMVVS